MNNNTIRASANVSSAQAPYPATTFLLLAQSLHRIDRVINHAINTKCDKEWDMLSTESALDYVQQAIDLVRSGEFILGVGWVSPNIL